VREPAVTRVLVYHLYQQEELEERDIALEHHLAAPGPGAPIEPWFESLPGGCFRWEDAGRLHGSQFGGTLPGSAAAARAAAAAYMRAANDATARFRAARGIDRNRFPDPFPIESLQPADVRRVRSKQTGRDDHWLTTWSLFLPCTPGLEGGRSLVFGATVELRVGEGSRVVSVVSRVRPWRAVSSRPALAYSSDDEHAREVHAPALVYISDNPFEPQRFLAPCWLIAPEDEESHHARRFWPASDHTVLPEIVVEDQDGEGTVRALVLTERQRATVVEHGAEWQLRWSVATLREYIAGEHRASEGSSAPLPGPGIYQVELELEHVATGAVRSTHSQIAIGQAQPRNRELQSFSQS
jgi:hypothetical protein